MMIPEKLNILRNWDDYVVKVNTARISKPGHQCRIDLGFPDWLKDMVNEYASTLTWRERAVLRLRFGMEDGEFWTYSQIAIQMELSIERVRQILAKVLYKSGHARYGFKNKQARINYLNGLRNI